VFAVGFDSHVWHIWQSFPNSSFSSWESLGGWVDALVAGLNDDGKIEVYGTGVDGRLWHIAEKLAPGDPWYAWSSSDWTGVLLKRVGTTPVLLCAPTDPVTLVPVDLLEGTRSDPPTLGRLT
jgi:hypothetical protein